MASAALTPTGRQYTDSAGVPLAGGSIATYLTGTTTATPTWSAIAMGGGNLNANPVVLGSDGRATIFILRGLGYRFVVRDSAGVVQETIDGVLVADDTYTHTPNIEVPVGGVLPFCGTAAPSANYLLCDGAAVSRTTYATLFGICGVKWGVGDNSTTFNVPNMRGFYPFGQSPASVSTAANPTLGTNQSGTDLAAGNYKVAIVGVGANGAVGLPSSAITQAVGAGGAGRIVVTYVLPTGASKARVYVTTLAGATPDRYFEATASPYMLNTLTGATVGALPIAATTTGQTLGATFGAIDHAHVGASHLHALSGATASDGTEAVTGATASDTAKVTASSSAGVDGAGSNFLCGSLTDAGHTHEAGTLAGPAHTHAVGTLADAAEGVRESTAGNVPSVVFSWLIRCL